MLHSVVCCDYVLGSACAIRSLLKHVLLRHMPQHVLVHMLDHILRHTSGRHVLEHLTGHVRGHAPKHVLKHVPAKHVSDHVLEHVPKNKLLEPPSSAPYIYSSATVTSPTITSVTAATPALDPDTQYVPVVVSSVTVPQYGVEGKHAVLYCR